MASNGRSPTRNLMISRLALLVGLAPALAAQSPTYHAVRSSPADIAVSNATGQVLLSIPGLWTDFLISGGGQFVELPDGTAHLTGRVFSDASIYSALLFDIHLTGHTVFGNAGYPPSGYPDQQLLPAAYVPLGAVDPATFSYYTAGTGTLTGVRNLDGLVLDIALTGAAQVGEGANNRNGALGLQADFAVTVVQQPFGGPIGTVSTAHVTVDLPLHHTDDTTHPQQDATRSTLLEHAMSLPGVADDYLFVPAGDFTEFEDGHAELTGTLARLSQLDDAWDLTMQLTQRIDPGQAGYPPVGSPVLQMLPSAYVANGGTMDPSSWHYYQSAVGTLVGKGMNQGGQIDLTNSVALQYGGAANQLNSYFGFYGAFTASLLTQPTPRTLTISGTAELHGLTAVFPVLPFPILTVPTPSLSLPTLTDQGVILDGDNLAWIELVGVGTDLIGGHSAADWNGGYFVILDNQHIELHPRPDAVPGTYNVGAYNPAIRTNEIPLDLVAPTTPKLYGEAAVDTGYTAHVHLHQGTVIGPTISIVVLSNTLLPSVAPGIVNLGIGNQFADITLDPTVYLHDPATGIAHADYGPIPASIQGMLFHFQGLILDLGAPALPLPETNVWSVQF